MSTQLTQQPDNWDTRISGGDGAAVPVAAPASRVDPRTARLAVLQAALRREWALPDLALVWVFDDFGEADRSATGVHRRLEADGVRASVHTSLIPGNLAQQGEAWAVYHRPLVDTETAGVA
jgi:hypothetical protein